MHSTLFRILEVLVYTLVNSVPYHLCILYTFRKSLRFPLPVSIALLLIPTALELGLYLSVAFGLLESSSLITLAWSVGYIAGYLLLVREPVGKVVFLLLVLMNIANFNVVASKCLESYLFPAYAMERYHYTNTLTMLLCELGTVLPHFVTLRRRYIPALQRRPEGFLWHYLWLVPTTFYFLWLNHIHFGSASSLEVATNITTMVFLGGINCGSYLIYSIVLNLVNESAKNAELRSSNHQLAMQTLQYENLQERITEARKASHDLRHHIAAMNGYLEKEDYASLKDYFHNLMDRIPESNGLVYCEHNTLNMLFSYFGQLAREQDIHYVVKLRLPALLPIADDDLAVLLGNLVENAVEACTVQHSPDKQILIGGRYEGRRLLFTIDNTFDHPLRKDRSGIFLSGKHPGIGIGVESAKAIVLRHGGQFQIDHTGGMFRVSILMDL